MSSLKVAQLLTNAADLAASGIFFKLLLCPVEEGASIYFPKHNLGNKYWERLDSIPLSNFLSVQARLSVPLVFQFIRHPIPLLHYNSWEASVP